MFSRNELSACGIGISAVQSKELCAMNHVGDLKWKPALGISAVQSICAMNHVGALKWKPALGNVCMQNETPLH